MHYSPRADEIVFDQEPRGRSKLLDEGRDYVAMPQALSGGTIVAAAARVPGFVSRSTTSFEGTPFFPEQPVIFMHERTAPSGRKYIVMIEGTGWYDSCLRLHRGSETGSAAGELTLGWDGFRGVPRNRAGTARPCLVWEIGAA